MPKQRNIIAFAVIALIIVGAYAFFERSAIAPISDSTLGDATATPANPSIPEGFSPLISEPYGFGVLYPKKYYVSASELDASTTPHLAVVMVLDTKEHRDLLAGRITAPREGPNGITINVYPNTGKLTAEEFARQDVNWNVSDKKLTPTTIAGEAGAIYRWSGLFEGASAILAREKFIYVFAVSWQSPEDPIIIDFDQMLQTLRFNDETVD